MSEENNVEETKQDEVETSVPTAQTPLAEEGELLKAMSVLVKVLRKDKERGSYYYGWQSNIAMAMFDTEGNTNSNEICNEGAKNFLEFLIREAETPVEATNPTSEVENAPTEATEATEGTEEGEEKKETAE